MNTSSNNPPPASSAEDLFSAAVNMTVESQEKFLNNACHGDPALLAEVRGLLQAHQNAPSGFLRGDAADGECDITPKLDPRLLPPPPPPCERAGGVIGRYKLLRKMGEGGFGRVWLSEQLEPVSRRVALKIIKAGMNTTEVIARFEQEQQALAKMDHPGIAKVFDAGSTPEGRPFFVMEYVPGVPITEYCDQQRLNTHQRLELFGEVCAAIHHAHQKGVIHRDIKPSNVLVALRDNKGEVKVIDFGIAKATQGSIIDHAPVTRIDQFIGTPVYMSPEQANLTGVDIDTRSDIYSLGALLYELLTGKPPFEPRTLLSAGHEEMRRIIREVDPPKPSSRMATSTEDERAELAKTRRATSKQLDNVIEPDLDWIVMKAIEKDRTLRYETAHDFARDVFHFLADEPVSARPPTAGYQFRKFARRHKLALRVAAAMTMILVSATLVSIWYAVKATEAEQRAHRETNRALASEQVASDEADRANTEAERAKQAEKRAEDEAAHAKSSERQANADAQRAKLAEEMANTRLKEVTAERDAKELAKQDAEAVSKFLTEVILSPDPYRAGHQLTVPELLDAAVAKLDTEFAKHPERKAKVQSAIGCTYYSLGLNDKAIAIQESVLDYYVETLGLENEETIGGIIALGNTYGNAGRYDDMLKMEQKAFELAQKLYGDEHPFTLKTRMNLALSYGTVFDRADEAIKIAEEVLPLERKINGPEHEDTLTLMLNLGIFYHAAGRQDDAMKQREATYQLLKRVKGNKHPFTIASAIALAQSYDTDGRKNDARPLFEEALACSRETLGSTNQSTLLYMFETARFYGNIGRHTDELKLMKEAFAGMKSTLGPQHPLTLGAMHNLANAFFDTGRKDEALQLREQVLPLYEKVLGESNQQTLDAMHNLAISYDLAGQKTKARNLRAKIWQINQRQEVNAPPSM